MKIVDLETFVVANPPPSYGGRYFVFVKLTTDGGVTGIGEVYSVPFSPGVVESMIADVFARHLLDHDPTAIERLWRAVYATGYTLRSDLSMMAILSGLEMACWDIIGKEAGRPVYELLGGRVHDRLRTYTYLYPEDGDRTDVYADPDLAAQRAAQYADLGFTAIKFDPADRYTAFDPSQPSLESLDRIERFVRQIREAVGTRCDLLFGTHGQFSPSGALRVARRIEPYDPLWFEEPVPPENVDAMATVAHGTSIPVATGERLATKYEFREILTRQAAQILQPNLGRVGGILEAKKIAAMAEAHYAHVAPHMYAGPIEAAACVQLDTCSPNFLIQEGIRRWDGFHAELLHSPPTWEDGYLIPPTTPGLGVELDESVARAHPYEGSSLHLDVHPRRV
ncbi:MAG TPA: mandelate racemase/muconate lactonizing enzyme family protein [Acidimicrobiia bacterium]|jgi:2-dehydro-3-deoxyphosphogalactonate aldolase|nr:mandelate racemase/muconate lactonizing enzyme family protein [Acidimicrobiia bacterium]